MVTSDRGERRRAPIARRRQRGERDTVLHMVDVETGRFTVGVFADLEWARKGLAALQQAGFPAEGMSVVAKDAPGVAEFVQSACGGAPAAMELPQVGSALVRGPLVEVLQGSGRDLAKSGLGGTMRKVGFQAHDGRIYETLAARGGVLVAIRSEPRAADALAILFSYGGGNAAIGAWTGRV